MAVDPKDINILLVEDAVTMRKIEIKTLKSLGFENIIECIDGNDAVEKLESGGEVHLIISDWNMPNKDGYQLLLWVRENERFKHIPFIMATGQGDMKQEKKALEAGVSSFIAKPFNAEDLKQKIDIAFGDVEPEKAASAKERVPKKSESGKITLRIAHIQITDHLVIGVLKHLIDRGELAPRYFEMELHRMTGWNPVKEALGRGTVDAACVLAPIAMDLYSFGSPIKMILLAHKNGSIFVRNRADQYVKPYQNFFRGKSFYIPHQLSIHHMLGHIFFKNIGLHPGVIGQRGIDINFEVVDPIQMPEFLRANRDAGGFLVAEPLGTTAIARGIAELQFLTGELWEQHPCCIVAMRDDIIGPYPDAVHEFTEMLVQAGRFIEKKTEMAAEIAVRFLDPEKRLGLRVPLLKNVLREERGIKYGNLYPEIEDFEKIQEYMCNEMGIGSRIDLDRFIETQFADVACRDRQDAKKSILHAGTETAIHIMQRSGEAEVTVASKTMLNKEGKYLTFALGHQEFGIDILRIKEIIGMMAIRSVPQAPLFVKGVINLRGNVIPVMDLRLRFDMEEVEYNDRTCIIVLEQEVNGKNRLKGIAVDSVSEVLAIKASEIEDAPTFGMGIDTDYILAVAKIENGVKILLDIDNVLGDTEPRSRAPLKVSV